MASFCDANYLVGCYDTRRISALLSDNNVPIPSANLETNLILIQLLNEATGLICTACEQGERYNEADLFTLAASGSTGGFVLQRLCADLTFALLVSRRAQGAADIDRQCPRYGQALQQLEQLRQGERILPGIDGAGDAGLPGLGNVNPGLNLNNPVTYSQLAAPLFPLDPSRLPPFNQGYWGGC